MIKTADRVKQIGLDITNDFEGTGKSMSECLACITTTGIGLLGIVITFMEKQGSNTAAFRAKLIEDISTLDIENVS